MRGEGQAVQGRGAWRWLLCAAVVALVVGGGLSYRFLRLKKTTLPEKKTPVSYRRDGSHYIWMSASDVESLLPPLPADAVERGRAVVRRLDVPLEPGHLSVPPLLIIRSPGEFEALESAGGLYQPTPSPYRRTRAGSLARTAYQKALDDVDTEREAVVGVHIGGSSSPHYLAGTPTLEGRTLTLRVLRISGLLQHDDSHSTVFLFAVDASKVDTVEVVDRRIADRPRSQLFIAVNLDYEEDVLRSRGSLKTGETSVPGGAAVRHAPWLKTIQALRDRVIRHWTACQDASYPAFVGRAPAVYGEPTVVFEESSDDGMLVPLVDLLPTARIATPTATEERRLAKETFQRCLRSESFREPVPKEPGITHQVRYSLRASHLDGSGFGRQRPPNSVALGYLKEQLKRLPGRCARPVRDRSMTVTVTVAPSREAEQIDARWRVTGHKAEVLRKQFPGVEECLAEELRDAGLRFRKSRQTRTLRVDVDMKRGYGTGLHRR